MSLSSVTIPSDLSVGRTPSVASGPASIATTVVAGLREAAAAFAIAELPAAVVALMHVSFQAPADGADCGSNRLLPGRMPLELSYSEGSPDTLRFDMEPFGRQLSPTERRDAAIAWFRATAAQLPCQSEPNRVQACIARWLPAGVGARATFGAFLGGTIERARPAWPSGGLTSLKLYLELDPANGRSVLRDWAPDLLAAAMRLTGAEPHFASIALGGGGVAERLYLACRARLDLAALAPLFNPLGLAAALPRTTLAVLAITGGAFTLPANGALVGLRQGEAGPEVKLDIVLPCSGAAALIPRLRQLQREQSGSAAALDRWLAMLGRGSPPDLTVASITVGPDLTPRLNLYGSPAWLDPRRRRGFA